jgi:hypothetical protein
MNSSIDINWFKKEVAPSLTDYELKYKFFEEGDLGSLDQVEFNSEQIGGNIDFWNSGWLGIFVWDYRSQEQLYNILLEPQQETDKKRAFEKLRGLIIRTLDKQGHS